MGIYFSRSTNHGVTFSHPLKVSQTISDVQFPDIAVTGNSNIYLVFRSFDSGRGHEGNEFYYVRSTDCGRTFTRPIFLQDFIENDAQDIADPEEAPTQSQPDDPAGEEEPEVEGNARDCGDFDAHCESGFTFFRRDTQPRATADQFDKANPNRFYVVYDATKAWNGGSNRLHLRDDRVRRREPGCDLLPARQRNERVEVRADADRRRGDRAPDPPGHLRGQSRPDVAWNPAHDLVGLPKRCVLQRDAADRQLREPLDGAVTGAP